MVSVLRPGQRILNIPGIGVQTSRRTVASATAHPTNFLTASYTGIRNDFDGWVGYRFVPAADISIVALGRSVSGSIAQSHAVNVYLPFDLSILATVTITGSSVVDALGYAYEHLGSPVILTGSVEYIIGSREYDAGDAWRDLGSLSGHSALAAITNGAYGGGGNNPPSFVYGGADQGYVPPTFFTAAA